MCPDGFYEDYVDHKCEACDSKCSTCDINSTYCQTCTETGSFEAFLFADNSSCMAICPDGFYENYTNHHCEACDDKCSICTENSSYCQVCNSEIGPNEAFLFDSSCLSVCPAAFYENNTDHKCYACN